MKTIALKIAFTTTLLALGTACKPQFSNVDSSFFEAEDLVLQFSNTSTEITESAGQIQLEIVTNRAPGVPVTVTLAYGDETTLTPGTELDLPAEGAQITLSEDSTSTNVIIIANDDFDQEAAQEYAQFVLQNPSAEDNSTVTIAEENSTHLLTVLDDDEATTVDFTTTADFANEDAGGGATVTFAVELTNPISENVVVPYTISGTADGTDSDCADGSITIIAGNTTANDTCTVSADTTYELDQTIIATLGDPGNANIGTDNVFTFTVQNDDGMPTVTFDHASDTVAEGDATDKTITLQVNISPLSEVPASVGYTFDVGTTTELDDHDCVAGTIVVPSMTASASMTCTAYADTKKEPDDTLNLKMGTLTDAIAGAQTTYSYVIQDDDVAPTVAFTTATSNADEGTASDGTITVTAQLSALTEYPVTAAFTMGAGTAEAEDHDCAADTINIASETLTGSYVCKSNKDDKFEPADTVSFVMGATGNATASGITTQTHTIDNDDTAPVVNFLSTTDSGNEGTGANGTISYTFVLSALTEYDVDVDWTLGAGSAEAGDHNCAAGSTTINAETASKLVTCESIADTQNEPTDTVILNLSTITNATAGTDNTFTYSILNDDSAPTVTFASATASGAEGTASNTSFNLTANLSEQTEYEVKVPYTLGAGSAEAEDHNVPASGEITIAAGTTSGFVTFQSIADTKHEPTDTVILNMGTPDNATASGITTHTYSITNDDTKPNVQFKVASNNGNEGNGSNETITVTVELDAKTEFDVDVPFTMGAGTAEAEDHNCAADTIEITGETLEASYTCESIADTKLEPQDDLVFNMGTPDEATASGQTTFTWEIKNDDSVPTVSWSASAASVNEGTGVDGAITFTAQLSQATEFYDVTVPFSITGTGSKGGDHNCANDTITISAGDSSQDYDCNSQEDSTYENDETVIATIGTPTNATASGTTVFTHTIANDDSAPVVNFNSASSSMTEGDTGTSGFLVSLVLTGDTDLDVDIDVTVAGSNMDNPADHDCANVTKTISSGGTSVKVSCNIVGDYLVEPNGTLTFEIDSVTGGTEGVTGTHTLTVNDNDVAPSGLSYPTPMVLVKDQPSIDVAPTITPGSASVTWSVSPSLPSGLILKGTGNIGGSPDTVTAAADYTITATSAVGSTDFDVNIEVINAHYVDVTSTGADDDPTDGICATSGGDCTLQAAIEENNDAGGGDAKTIFVPNGTYEPGLKLSIDRSYTVQGESRDGVIIDGKNGHQVFEFSGAGHTMTIKNLTVTRGYTNSSAGAGVTSTTGSKIWSIENCVLHNNNVRGQGGAIAVHNRNAATIHNSIIRDNSALNTGLGGAIFSIGTTVIQYSAIYDNYAAVSGGAIYYTTGGVSISTTIKNSTLYNNSSGTGEGSAIYNSANKNTIIKDSTVFGNNSANANAALYLSGTSNFVIGNSILSDNEGPVSTGNTCANDGTGSFTTNGYNIHDLDQADCEFTGTGDSESTDPVLGAFQADGDTFTMIPAGGSPAIDNGNNATCEADDQRGVARPVNGTCDIGAVEVE